MVADVKVEGVETLVAKLRAITPALRKKALGAALRAGAALVRDDAKRRVPILSEASALRNPYRRPGTVKKAIRVRTSNIARRAGDVGVFVNVKPAAGARYRVQTTRVLGLKFKDRTLVRASRRGAQSPVDPFYWRFLEFGTRRMAARPFLKPAGGMLGAALGVIETTTAQWFRKVDASGQVVP
jgi:HK97 gp10 family phage protein